MAYQTVHNHQTRHQTLTYLFFPNCAPHSNKFFCFALTKTSHRNGDSDGWRDGDSNERCDDDMTATTVMDGATVTGMAMDGATAMQQQRKAQWKCKCNDGNGRREGNGNGWRGSDVMAMTVMDGAMAMAMDGATEMQCQQKARRQRNGNNGDSNGRHDGGLAMTEADTRILPMPNLQEG